MSSVGIASTLTTSLVRSCTQMKGPAPDVACTLTAGLTSYGSHDAIRQDDMKHAEATACIASLAMPLQQF